MTVLILHVCKADDRTRRFSTTKPSYRVGRAADNDLVLPSDRVADHHCVLHAGITGIVVEPLAGSVLARGTPLAGTTDVGIAPKLYVGEYLLDVEWRPGDVDPLEDELVDAAASGDGAARLVYADWLEGNGQLAHATFVRLQDQLLDPALPVATRAQLEVELMTAANRTEPRWRMRIARAPVLGCTMNPPCGRDWVHLTDLGLPHLVRRCEECTQLVPYVYDLTPFEHEYNGLPQQTHALDILPTPTPRGRRPELPTYKGRPTAIFSPPPPPRNDDDDGR